MTAIDGVRGTREALAELDTPEALRHLELVRRSLEELAARLHREGKPGPAEQRRLERELLQFRAELRQAKALADQGLAFCQDWAEMLRPAPGYQADGGTTAGPGRAGLSVEG